MFPSAWSVHLVIGRVGMLWASSGVIAYTVGIIMVLIILQVSVKAVVFITTCNDHNHVIRLKY